MQLLNSGSFDGSLPTHHMLDLAIFAERLAKVAQISLYGNHMVFVSSHRFSLRFSSCFWLELFLFWINA